MRSQIVTASPANAVADTSKRNIRHLPYAFTEHGALMAANILNSPRAVAISVSVIRAFARLRYSAFCTLPSSFPCAAPRNRPSPKSASTSKKTPSLIAPGNVLDRHCPIGNWTPPSTFFILPSAFLLWVLARGDNIPAKIERGSAHSNILRNEGGQMCGCVELVRQTYHFSAREVWWAVELSNVGMRYTPVQAPFGGCSS
jgi:hypothetical protein